ncbi:IPT/TIG domain-containing protein [Occallatibacter riparius]|uniref:IPT/TIG domain-containing protein n=1 Tax=Occallatibacter riparius TaxID=1002689 RepID=A0A9J7BJM2_9BACT|nr:IPT/TIG domain-containing protein [Occallatibacter riparius]UWZ81986.1 IPT/TIG domain-containing protein [Occallatibacter riparius]
MASTHRRLSLAALLTLSLPLPLAAGGPRLVAGSTYFDLSVMGKPIRWPTGQVNYYVDQGPLSATVTHAQAVTMVDAAAALWSGVPTAAVSLINMGPLREDVSGLDTVAGNGDLVAPNDVAATATDKPIAVVFDADGSVIDAVLGSQASDPMSCNTTGVVVWTDGINTDATLAHAAIVLNGRCTNTASRLKMMTFLLERAFGLVLGLGHSQVYPDALRQSRPEQAQAWPVMQPLSGVCGQGGGQCIPNLHTLQYDDVAELNRLYPVTAENHAAFPGKMLTAANTVSITGNITFRAGTGMQGVNVVAVPLDPDRNPLYQYTVTAVSGTLFSGNHGNPVTGWTDTNGTPLSQYGSADPAVQGTFDLSYMPLPPGMTSASYQITFEPIDPLYIMEMTVGPYYWGSPDPSGTLSPMTVAALAAGASTSLTINVGDSASGGYSDAISTEQAPRLLPTSGFWSGRLSQVGQGDWFNFPVRGNRMLTIVTQAVDERGLPTDAKAMPSIGVWDGFFPVGAASVGYGPAFNGFAAGETWLRVATEGDDVLRVGIADLRGDGRPDYAYNGWVLYADSVEPSHLPASGGPIVIRGLGFRANDTVLVGGRAAQVTSVSPNEITAIAPSAEKGRTGSVDVEIDDLPLFYAASIIGGGISYDAGSGDSLALVTAPSNTIPIGVPTAFTVTALAGDLQPAHAVTVTYRVQSGTAKLACGSSSCSVTTGGDGSASMNVTAMDGTKSVVVASLTDGANVKANFTGGTPPTLAAMTPSLSIAEGASATWTTEALVLKSGVPLSGQTVTWQTGSGISVGSSKQATSNAAGIAAKSLSVGPLSPGGSATATACVNGTAQCVTFTATGAQPGSATVEAVGGTRQSLSAGGTPDQIMLRVRDTTGNPMAGATVTLAQAVYAWAPPCPPHGRCAQAELLANQTASATSAIDGTVTFAPASLAGAAVNVSGIAATGDASTVGVVIEIHP